MPITLSEFVQERFDERPLVRNVYSSVVEYQRAYINAGGLDDWLMALSGQTLPLSFLTQEIVPVYLRDARRSPYEIPSILASISRQYDITLPDVPGLLTAQFWEAQTSVPEPSEPEHSSTPTEHNAL